MWDLLKGTNMDRLAEVVRPFGEHKIGHVFTYNPEVDERIVGLIDSGIMKDLGEVDNSPLFSDVDAINEAIDSGADEGNQEAKPRRRTRPAAE